MTAPEPAAPLVGPPAAADQLRWAEDAMTRFAVLLGAADLAADLAAPVPSCPGWDLAALAGHLGQVHAWARGCLVEGHPNVEPPATPSAPVELAGWYRQQADDLLGVLRAIDPAAPAWGFGPKPRTAAFWFRRQQHETSMHLWDALAALGARPGYGGVGAPAAAVRAADGLAEVRSVFLPRQVRLKRIPPLQRSLGLVGTDVGLRVVLAGDGVGDPAFDPAFDPAGEPVGGPEATVSGTAEALVLLVWGRLDLAAGLADGRLSLTGDEQAARSVLAAGVVP